MEANQNSNQYFIHHQTHATYSPIINNPINIQQYFQPFCLPNYYTGYPCGPPQQMMYYPYPLMPPQSIHPTEQNSNFFENTSQADIEKLLLETIPDLDGTEGSFEIKKFFKKFDLALQDWPEKKKIFALKSKLDGKARSYFILAIKSKHYNYKSIKNFILCQLLPPEYKVEEPIDLVKKQTHSPQQKKNLKEHEKIFKSQNIPTPSFKNRVNIQFEKEEFSKEILEFFEMPINQDSANEEIEIVRNNFGKDFECGFLKRKIMGRFFHGVRGCLNSEKLITMISVPQLSKNFPKEMDNQMFELKPMKVLKFVSVTKQDIIRESKDVGTEKDWKKRKRKQESGLVESVSVTEFLTIGVHLETFHRRSGLINRVGLENPMINFDTETSKSIKRKELPRHPRPFRKTDRTKRTHSDVEDAVI